MYFKELVAEMGISGGRVQMFRNLLSGWVGFKPSCQSPNKKWNLTQEEVSWIKERFPDENSILEENKRYSIAKNLEKWGHASSNSSSIKRSKISRTLKERGTNREKYRQTCLERYGVESANSLETKKEKAKRTCQERYGGNSSACAGSELKKRQIKHALQTKLERYGTTIPKAKYICKGQKFDSKLEIYYYLYHTEVLHEGVKRGPVFQYKDAVGKSHEYHCDFEVNGKFVEIKGKAFVRDGRLYFPFVKQEKVNAKEEQAVWDAKQRCMDKHGVILLTDDDLQEEKRYGKQRWEELNVQKLYSEQRTRKTRQKNTTV